MKINLLYFSSTGNTHFICKKFKEKLSQLEHNVTEFDIVTENQSQVLDCDMLGIFYPVWACTLPPYFFDFMKNINLNKAKGKKVFIIATYESFIGNTNVLFKRKLQRKGFTVVFQSHFLFPANVYIPGINFSKKPTKAEIDEMVNSALSRIDYECIQILSEQYKKEKISFKHKIISWGFRRCYILFNIFKRRMKINKSKCTKCCLCVKICPTGNINLNPEKEIKIGNNCIFCVKCYNLCPQNAILIGKKSKNTEKYKRYKGLFSGYSSPQYR